MILLEDKNMLDFTSILMIALGVVVFIGVFVMVKRWERKSKEREKNEKK